MFISDIEAYDFLKESLTTRNIQDKLTEGKFINMSDDDKR